MERDFMSTLMILIAAGFADPLVTEMDVLSTSPRDFTSRESGVSGVSTAAVDPRALDASSILRVSMIRLAPMSLL
jgi:hypothetical protein